MTPGCNQREAALRGILTPEVRACAEVEKLPPEVIRDRVADGTVVLLKNRRRETLRPVAVGAGLRTKVNANLGTSPDRADPGTELLKAEAALESGADTIMDLSIGGDQASMRRRLLTTIPLPLGTVPVYEAAAEALRRGRPPAEFHPEDLFRGIERHAEEGVDFMTIHGGVTQAVLEALERSPRVLGIVSRGGAILAAWMRATGRENPLYEQFDRILEIARAGDIVLSLGDALRPGCLADAGDDAQIREMVVLGDLVRRARAGGVQVMVEGPGHVPLARIRQQVELAKRLGEGAPLYVLGPLPTDIAPGWDHLAAAVGGAIAAWAGADFLCAVTPAEHLSLPDVAEVRAGVLAARIAAHAADIAKGIPGADRPDRDMAAARRRLDWETQAERAIDPGLVRRRLERSPSAGGEACTMCGRLCAVRLQSKAPRGGPPEALLP
ncbi:MAG: phosphomethylpyrimidine synthase ThiC [Desulfobacterales bacterium]